MWGVYLVMGMFFLFKSQMFFEIIFYAQSAYMFNGWTNRLHGIVIHFTSNHRFNSFRNRLWSEADVANVVLIKRSYEKYSS